MFIVFWVFFFNHPMWQKLILISPNVVVYYKNLSLSIQHSKLNSLLFCKLWIFNRFTGSCKDGTGRSHVLFQSHPHPVVVSYVTIGQYGNQDTDIDTMCLSSSVSFMTYVDSCSHHWDQDRKLSLPFTVTLPSPTLFHPWKLLIFWPLTYCNSVLEVLRKLFSLLSAWIFSRFSGYIYTHSLWIRKYLLYSPWDSALPTRDQGGLGINGRRTAGSQTPPAGKNPLHSISKHFPWTWNPTAGLQLWLTLIETMLSIWWCLCCFSPSETPHRPTWAAAGAARKEEHLSYPGAP